MGYNPGGDGGISSASDVALSNTQNNQVLSYDTTVAKWKNDTLVATDVSAVPLATGGQAMRVVGYGTSLPTTGQAGDIFFLQGS